MVRGVEAVPSLSHWKVTRGTESSRRIGGEVRVEPRAGSISGDALVTLDLAVDAHPRLVLPFTVKLHHGRAATSFALPGTYLGLRGLFDVFIHSLLLMACTSEGLFTGLGRLRFVPEFSTVSELTCPLYVASKLSA